MSLRMNFNPPKATDILRNPERNLSHKNKTEHEKKYINMGIIFKTGIVILGTKKLFPRISEGKVACSGFFKKKLRNHF